MATARNSRFHGPTISNSGKLFRFTANERQEHTTTLNTPIRATSHTRLRARDHYTSSTLIGGKGGADPSSLHTTLEGLTAYVNARWM